MTKQPQGARQMALAPQLGWDIILFPHTMTISATEMEVPAIRSSQHYCSTCKRQGITGDRKTNVGKARQYGLADSKRMSDAREAFIRYACRSQTPRQCRCSHVLLVLLHITLSACIAVSGQDMKPTHPTDALSLSMEQLEKLSTAIETAEHILDEYIKLVSMNYMLEHHKVRTEVTLNPEPDKSLNFFMKSNAGAAVIPPMELQTSLLPLRALLFDRDRHALLMFTAHLLERTESNLKLTKEFPGFALHIQHHDPESLTDEWLANIRNLLEVGSDTSRYLRLRAMKASREQLLDTISKQRVSNGLPPLDDEGGIFSWGDLFGTYAVAIGDMSEFRLSNKRIEMIPDTGASEYGIPIKVIDDHPPYKSFYALGYARFIEDGNEGDIELHWIDVYPNNSWGLIETEYRLIWHKGDQTASGTHTNQNHIIKNQKHAIHLYKIDD